MITLRSIPLLSIAQEAEETELQLNEVVAFYYPVVTDIDLNNKSYWEHLIDPMNHWFYWIGIRSTESLWLTGEIIDFAELLHLLV